MIYASVDPYMNCTIKPSVGANAMRNGCSNSINLRIAIILKPIFLKNLLLRFPDRNNMKSIVYGFVLVVSIALLLSSCSEDNSSTITTTTSSDDSSNNSSLLHLQQVLVATSHLHWTPLTISQVEQLTKLELRVEYQILQEMLWVVSMIIQPALQLHRPVH